MVGFATGSLGIVGIVGVVFVISKSQLRLCEFAEMLGSCCEG